MKIGKYISNLLYTHDSVLLPGFGTFTTKYVPAKFIPEKKVVESPAKIADFSTGVREGETPLAAYIAKQEGMAVEEVQDFFRKLVKEIDHSLEAGKKVELESIGIFHIGPDGIMHFEPDTSVNYLEEATGIPEIPTPTPKIVPTPAPKTVPTPEPKAVPTPEPRGIEKKQVPPPPAPAPEPVADTPKHKEPKEEPHPESETQTQETMKDPLANTNLPPALKWLAYTIVPLIVILIILFLNFNFFFGTDGLFRSSDKHATVQVEPAQPVTPPVAEVPAEPEPEPVEEVSADPSVVPPRPESGRTAYYIVVGSFQDQAKAEQLAFNLRSEGASLASVFMRTHSEFHRVCYGYYYDLSEAESVKASLSDDLREIAWILHR